MAGHGTQNENKSGLDIMFADMLRNIFYNFSTTENSHCLPMTKEKKKKAAKTTLVEKVGSQP